MINRVISILKSIPSKEGFMALATALATIAVVNRVPKLRNIVKGE